MSKKHHHPAMGKPVEKPDYDNKPGTPTIPIALTAAPEVDLSSVKQSPLNANIANESPVSDAQRQNPVSAGNWPAVTEVTMPKVDKPNEE